MSGSQRNAPCPCGSGKKYKRCCAPIAAAGERPAWTPADIKHVSTMLTELASSSYFAGATSAAMSEFFGDAARAATQEQRQALFEHEQTSFAFYAWLFFDAYITKDKHRLMETLLAPDVPLELNAGQRCYLERMAVSCMHPYLIREVRLDRGLLLEDLWSGDEIEVSEKAATRYLKPRLTIVTRLIEGPRGSTEIFGGILELAPDVMDELLVSLRASFKGKRRRRPDLGEVEFFKEAGPRMARPWIERFTWTMPELRTTDGAPLRPQDLIYDVLDQQALHEALVRCGEFDYHGSAPEYAWLGPGAKKADRGVLLGGLRIEGKRLRASVFSDERAERLQALLARIAPVSLRFRMSELHSIPGNRNSR